MDEWKKDMEGKEGVPKPGGSSGNKEPESVSHGIAGEMPESGEVPNAGTSANAYYIQPDGGNFPGTGMPPYLGSGDQSGAILQKRQDTLEMPNAGIDGAAYKQPSGAENMPDPGMPQQPDCGNMPGMGMPPQPGYGNMPGFGVPPQFNGKNVANGWMSPQPGAGMPYQNGRQPSGGYGRRTEDNLNGMAIASMVLGIVSIVLCFWLAIALPCAIIGLVLGCIYRYKGGKNGMSVAGIVCSSVGIGFAVIEVFLWIVPFVFWYF